MLTTPQLSTAERLLIDRRRRRETKAEAAERLSVSLYRYTQWESDGKGAPSPPLGELGGYESSVVLRVRSGLSSAEVAADVGVSPWWLRQMEMGDIGSSRLQAFWDDQGAVTSARASRMTRKRS